MDIKQTTVTCDSCKKVSHMTIDDWNKLSFPKGWMFRTRSFTVEQVTPTDIQIACSQECANKL